jgi:uncharacterized protein YdhG (YjbR/CyaY superfamily)
MAKKKAAKKAPKNVGLSAEEKAAARARVKELKSEAEGKAGESAVHEAIAKMTEPDRSMAKQFHEIVTSNAPSLKAKTWYGMPAYANEEGKVVCFYQAASKFETRYATIGFTDSSNLDEGNMWPNYYAIKKMGATEEKKIAALVNKAVS